VVLALQNAAASPEIQGLRLRPVRGAGATAKFDLTLLLEEQDGEVLGTAEYATDLFDAATIDRLLGQYERLLAAALAAPDRAIRELPLLTPAEHHQVLLEWNDTATDHGEDDGTTLIHDLFTAWAARTPEATAAVCGEASLTYGELAEQAHRLAGHLAGLGIGPGSLVGIHLRRGLPMLPAVLAVLKAGAAYVPLEVGHPPARLRWILEALDVSCVLTEEAQLGSLPALPHLICLDREEIGRIGPIGPIRPMIPPTRQHAKECW
jgi:aspartate racemase